MKRSRLDAWCCQLPRDLRSRRLPRPPWAVRDASRGASRERRDRIDDGRATTKSGTTTSGRPRRAARRPAGRRDERHERTEVPPSARPSDTRSRGSRSQLFVGIVVALRARRVLRPHPWLGGGFGMFSTVDERRLVAVSVAPSGEHGSSCPGAGGRRGARRGAADGRRLRAIAADSRRIPRPPRAQFASSVGDARRPGVRAAFAGGSRWSRSTPGE